MKRAVLRGSAFPVMRAIQAEPGPSLGGKLILGFECLMETDAPFKDP